MIVTTKESYMVYIDEKTINELCEDLAKEAANEFSRLLDTKWWYYKKYKNEQPSIKDMAGYRASVLIRQMFEELKKRHA